jgi:hypothetical protein
MPKHGARVSGDIVALAKAVNQRRLEFKGRFDGEIFKRDDSVSRILENDPDYVPHRPRRPDKKREPIRNPGIFTIQDIATKLHTTVGSLLGEAGFDITLDDRRTIRDLVLYLTRRFQLNDPRLSLGKDTEEYKFDVPEDRFRPRDYDYPRPLHAWAVPTAPAMGGAGGAEADFQLMATHVLHSIREVREGRLQVIRVIGDSMADRIEDGYKILVDTRLIRPSNGHMVAVYVKSEGGLLGYWRYERGRYWLDKHNTAYKPVALGHPDEWILWGTATTIVEAPIEHRR